MPKTENNMSKGEIRVTLRAELLDKDIDDLIKSRVKAVSREQVDKRIYEEVNSVVERRLTPENIDNIIKQIAEQTLNRNWSANRTVEKIATQWVQTNAASNTVQAVFRDPTTRAALKDIVRDVLKTSF